MRSAFAAPSPANDSAAIFASFAKWGREEPGFFAIVEFAKIDFHRSRREPRDPEPTMLELFGRDTKSGPSPVLPLLRNGTNRDDNPFNAYNIHAANLIRAWLTSLTWAAGGRYLRDSIATADAFFALLLSQ
jgi:hypothetical protein